RPPPRSTLLPYTTLFRSEVIGLRLPQPATRERVGARHVVRLPAVAGRRYVHAERLLAGSAIELGQQRVVIGGLHGGLAHGIGERSEEHTSELQSRENLVC